MSWAEIRTATKLKLESISGIENVKDYVIWTDDWNFIIQNFAIDGRINTWMVGLANNNNNQIEGDLHLCPYLINILAYYSIKTDDQSSKTFEDLGMAVRDEFMKSFAYVKTFVPTHTSRTLTRPPSFIVFDNTVFAQQACHRCQIQIPVEETIAQDLACSG